jgi:hypothetical protein
MCKQDKLRMVVRRLRARLDRIGKDSESPSNLDFVSLDDDYSKAADRQLAAEQKMGVKKHKTPRELRASVEDDDDLDISFKGVQEKMASKDMTKKELDRRRRAAKHQVRWPVDRSDCEDVDMEKCRRLNRSRCPKIEREES